MAQEKAKAKKADAKEEKGVAVAERKEVASTMSAADAAALVANVSKGDRESRNAGGIPVSFISLAQKLTKAVDEDNELYIEGLQPKDFFVQAKKLKLGKKIRVVPLRFVSVFNEMTGTGDDAKFVGIWRKKDAERYDLAPGSYFDRELPNGNVLRPATWMLVFLPDHPDIENPVITFKSTGQRTVKDIKKAIESNGTKGISCSLELELVAKNVDDGKGHTWLGIGWEIIDKLFSVEDGKLKFYTPYAEKCLLTANELDAADKASLLIQPRGGADSRAGESGASEEDNLDDNLDDDDDDGDAGTF